VVDRAFRTAMGRRCVTAIIIPADVQTAAYSSPPHEFKMVPGSLGGAAPEIVPPQAEIERAAKIIDAGERVAILIGQGARRAADEVEQLAEVTGGGVPKRCSARTSCPTTCPTSPARSGCSDRSRR
jgi:pyruvate dehydrogenase (quinone)